MTLHMPYMLGIFPPLSLVISLTIAAVEALAYVTKDPEG